MGKFYLIQRGSFRTNPSEKTSFLSGNHNALIDPDYMGAAEFEWGAIPKAYRRIFDHFDEYKLFITDMKTRNGVPFCLFCRKDCFDEVFNEIKKFIDNPYSLKEWSNLESHFKDHADKFDLRTDFWWNIDMTDVGDWIGFIGAADRQNAFTKIVNSDYKKLWIDKSEDEKEEIRKGAYSWP